MHLEWPCVHIVAREGAEGEEDQNGVDATDENGTLSQLDVPELLRNGKMVNISFSNSTYRLWEVLWQAKAPLDSKRLQTAAAPVHWVLGHQVDEGADDQRQVAKDEHNANADDWESWVHFVLHERCYFEFTLPAHCFYWSIREK